MRLYSRAQTTLIALLSLSLGLLVAGGAAIIAFERGTRGRPGATAAGADVSAGSTAAPSGAGQAWSPSGTPGLVLVDSLPGFSQDERENIDVYERLNPGVVNITTEIVSINWFLEAVPKEGGTGSGSIIDARGYVLTNNHVIKDAYKIYINLADGSRFEGKVVGTDPENDLAVVKFEPSKDMKLTVVPYGDSSILKVGQKVLAIGNPFGLERTLTSGIVSGLGRPVQQDDRIIIRDMIQTDASINPGNSGGPLLNSRGEIIGVNTMIFSLGGGSVGVGFAVPVNTAKRVVPDLIRYGMVKRGWIEAEYVQLFPALVDYMAERGSPWPVSKGLLVSAVASPGNADRAGIRGGATPVRYSRSVFNIGGDLIVSVDGMAVASVADLFSALEDNKPGDQVRVEFYRGAKKMSVMVTLSDRADSLSQKR